MRCFTKLRDPLKKRGGLVIGDGNGSCHDYGVQWLRRKGEGKEDSFIVNVGVSFKNQT